jgi:hypothetical protein
MFAVTAEMPMPTPHSQDVVERLKRAINAVSGEFDANDAVSVVKRQLGEITDIDAAWEMRDEYQGRLNAMRLRHLREHRPELWRDSAWARLRTLISIS